MNIKNDTPLLLGTFTDKEWNVLSLFDAVHYINPDKGMLFDDLIGTIELSTHR